MIIIFPKIIRNKIKYLFIILLYENQFAFTSNNSESYI